MTTSTRWPRGSGQWNRTRVVIVAASAARRDQLLERWAPDHDVVVVRSPLELIRRCEADGKVISTVVIADCLGSACSADLAEFLDQTYPHLRVIVDHVHRAALESSIPLEAQAYGPAHGQLDR